MTVEDAPAVVVVGAGPTGTTVATLLAQYGIHCLLLDRWAGVYRQPRAVHLDDEIYRVIARLGIAGEFAAISRPAQGLRLLDPTMKVLAEFRRDTSLSVNGFPQANMFDQPELETLLRANLERYACVELRGDAEVTGVTEQRDGRIRVTYVDRTDGSTHVVDTDYLLGCDGANSIVRTHIGSHMHDMKFDQRWLVIDAATPADLDQWDGVHQVCDPVRAGTYMRIGESRYRWEFRLLPGESADDFRTIEALRPLIAPWTQGVTDTEIALIRVAEYTFRARIADRWRRGNIFLLGDAAHLTPPFIGQGLGAGLRDAVNLAWKLAGVIKGELPPTALDSYEQERKPHAHHMIRLALVVGWAMTAGGEFGNLARRLLVTRLQLIPGMRTKVVDSRTPALHRSAFVRPTRGRLAGTLCPNPPYPDGKSLDDLLGDGFAMITAVAPTAGQRRVLDNRGVTIHIAPPDSEIAEWLRHGRATAALVRPDRTVMYAGHDVERICQVTPHFRWDRVSGRQSSGADGHRRRAARRRNCGEIAI
ncbi:3-(3-hydroxyphenyl)propionate hydroxylase [Mycolicibacterium moriokaense]|uniref:3-(3-hydroxyphenyl)propionate hydroxylase n=1 Tax=Mycolicibacterium moriokaense TaxID=39691 RepID=A0AAD1M879_9MYCO|nr:bifunctional 3-(3-hydroxy-phenyl)propionate/3-hydroxycinnamic acid hydroxylase [Mycolicibacterium moriokaense]MCV7040301.1 bifunctional 3-(3-hydroxy-phenyl)propionate/3-hydroxycinnamic acid hydroxylase [Mycolicibacterium moriokaense]ORB26003.1 3-(3-hydroxyphenyl)propionate hydroxylase [Mycolicibacterium moriokaense]BBX03241.1 3-(3-hydroxyphenyl)propionate hydroxylase [Mycolicibacterium moriokaense]